MATKTKTQPRVLLWLLVGVFITSLDSGIISTAKTTMSNYFHIAEVDFSWTISIYTLSLVVATPIMTNLIDKYGYKKTYLLELILYFTGIVGIYLSTDYSWFLLFRVFQAFGNSSVMVVAISYILANHTSEKGAKAGFVGMLTALGAIVAPVLSGINLALTHNWKNIYLLMAILIFVLFWLVVTQLPNMANEQQNAFDMQGTFWLIFSVLSLMFAMSGLYNGPLLWLVIILLLILSVMAFVFFLKVEHKRNAQEKYALFTSQLWQIKKYRLALISGLFCGLFMTAFPYLPSLMEKSFGLSSAFAGSFMTFMGLGTIFGAILAGKWVDRKGTIYTTKFAIINLIVSFILFVVMSWQIVLFILALIFFGFAIGMLMTAPLQVMIGEVDEKHKNSSLSFLSIMKKVGMSIGTLLFGAIFQLLPDISLHTPIFFSIEALLAILLGLVFFWIDKKQPGN